jgi:hypothetical protein
MVLRCTRSSAFFHSFHTLLKGKEIGKQNIHCCTNLSSEAFAYCFDPSLFPKTSPIICRSEIICLNQILLAHSAIEVHQFKDASLHLNKASRAFQNWTSSRGATKQSLLQDRVQRLLKNLVEKHGVIWSLVLRQHDVQASIPILDE